MEDRQQEFDEPPQGVVSGTDPRRLYAVIVVLLAVIVVLAIRPWGDGTTTPATTIDGQASQGQEGQAGESTDEPDGSLDAEPTSALPPDEAALVETCGSPSGWRAATLQAWTGRSTPIRSWIAIEPTTASGPLDPAIPFAPVATGIVTAIGYCAPLDEATRPPAVATASLWAIRDGQAIPLSLLPLEPSSPNALGGLWAPPAAVADAPAASAATRADLWPPGRYVVELASPGREYHQWLGIEIADLTLLRASPPVPAASSPPDASSSGSPAP